MQNSAAVTHYRWTDVLAERLTDTIVRRFITTSRVTIARFELGAGTLAARHAHDQEQITWIIVGHLRIDVDGTTYDLGAGELLHIPGGVPHETRAVQDTVALDIFSPPRNDWTDITSS